MRRILLVAAALLTALATFGYTVARAAGPNALDTSAGCYAETLPANDDGSSGVIALPFELDFFGAHYNTAYVNNNGNLTFTAPLSTYTPLPIVTGGLPIIAPFWADVDTRGSGSGLVHWGATTFAGRPAFCATWSDVGLGVGYYAAATDKLNSFQAILVDRSDVGAGDFDIVFNYDQIQWEAGSASGASGGLGGSAARAGFSSGDAADPARSFELAGSAVNGAFLDSSPTGLVNGSRNSPLQLGRYVFPVRNGAPPSGGSISGTISDPAASPVLGAFVQVCDAVGGGCPWTGTTNAAGAYNASGLPGGTYDVRAFPPAGSAYSPAALNGIVLAAASSLTGQDLQFVGPTPPPPGSGISPSHGAPGSPPVIFWGDSTTLTTEGCAGGAATWQIVLNGATIGGAMTEGPAGTYTAVVPPFYPSHGEAFVTMHVVCPGGGPVSDVGFSIYIDPSGFVRTVHGTPVQGATVTLYRSDSGADGSFDVVPDGSALMSPSNRANPDASDASGHFGWDVIAGFYRVRAEKAGCTSADGLLPYAESETLTIPPPVTNLELVLDCGPEDTTRPEISVTGLTREATGPSTIVDYVASFSDPDDAVVSSACSPAAGSGFPVGDTAVHCTATDSHGNVATGDVTVTVTDTTAPVLTVPGPISADATSPAGAAVSFAVSAADLVDGSIAPACSQPSGAAFPAGDTTVSCTATDAHGNSAVRSFSVHVAGAAEQLGNLLERVTRERLGPGFSLPAKIRAALDLLAARRPVLACLGLRALDHELRAQSGRKLTVAQASELRADVARIMRVMAC